MSGKAILLSPGAPLQVLTPGPLMGQAGCSFSGALYPKFKTAGLQRDKSTLTRLMAPHFDQRVRQLSGPEAATAPRSAA